MVDISISDKQMKPAVIHTDQFENGVHVLRFTLEDYMQNDIDLRKFNAYVVTSIKGVPDITQIPYTISGRSLILTWSLSAYTLKEPGVIQFQIRFSQTDADGTAVWYSYKGVVVNRLSINADDHMSANYPTLMKQWLNLMHTLSNEFGEPLTYMMPGESIPAEERLDGRLYYQWLDTPNARATVATGTVNLGKRPYADSGLYINNTHICIDNTDDVAYVIDPDMWVDAVNNANCGVIATDISSGEDIILLISAKDAGESGNSIGLRLDVAIYGAGKGIVNPSGGHVSGSNLSGGSDVSTGDDEPRGRFEDANGNILHNKADKYIDYDYYETVTDGDTYAYGYHTLIHSFKLDDDSNQFWGEGIAPFDCVVYVTLRWHSSTPLSSELGYCVAHLNIDDSKASLNVFVDPRSFGAANTVPVFLKKGQKLSCRYHEDYADGLHIDTTYLAWGS